MVNKSLQDKHLRLLPLRCVRFISHTTARLHATNRQGKMALNRRKILAAALGAAQITPHWAVLVNDELRPNRACHAMPKFTRN